MYLTYYHGSVRIRKSTGLEDTAKNRKIIENQVIPNLRYELQNGLMPVRKVKTFEEYAAIYLDEQKRHLKARTFVRYRAILHKAILPFFGKSPIDEIRVTDIRIWVNHQLATAMPKTVAEKLTIIRKIMRFAFEDEVINRNPVDAIRLPDHEQPDVEPFTVEEARLLIEWAGGWYANYLAVAFYSGMRPGEMLALKWSDIDMNAWKIIVRRSISRGNETSPKTKGSKRQIPIFDALWPYIQRQYRVTGLTNEYVFVVKETGAPFFDATSMRDNYWIPLLRRVGVPYRPQKNTRHTFAVQMLNSGTMRITDIARMMGHTSTQMLLTRYAKFIKSEELKIDREYDPFGHNLDTVENPKVEKPRISG